MAVSSSKPTLLLIQGSFQIPEVYGKLLKALEARGYPTVHPTLPSLTGHDEEGFGSKSLADDALAIQSELERLVEQEGKTVVQVMHSYGGLVGSEATLERFGRTQRKSQNLPGGVVHFIFFSAFLLAKGQSVLGVFGESPNNDVKPGGRYTIKNSANTLYNDLPSEDAEYWASKIIDQAYHVQTTELTREAYLYIPSTYIICENDQACPPQYQEMFAKTANADTKKISSGHSPMLSQPDELADIIAAVADGAVNRDG